MEDRGWLGGAHGQYRGIYNQIYNVQKYIVTVIIQVGSNRVVVHGMQWAAMVVQKKKEKKGVVVVDPPFLSPLPTPTQIGRAHV